MFASFLFLLDFSRKTFIIIYEGKIKYESY